MSGAYPNHPLNGGSERHALTTGAPHFFEMTMPWVPREGPLNGRNAIEITAIPSAIAAAILQLRTRRS